LKGIIKIPIFIGLFFIFSEASAQLQYQQIALGGGAGAAMAYAGAAKPQTNAAFYADICYYPVPVFNIGIEGQEGTLSGISLLNSRNHKNFSNSYKAVAVDANLYLGVFFKDQDDGFINVIKNFYGGIGFGVIANSVNNVNLLNATLMDHVNNTLKMIPFKGGYEYNILTNRAGEPVLKADVSLTLNYVVGKGLDGYYDNYANTTSFYTFYAIGLKYTIPIGGKHARDYNKFD